MNNLRPPRPNSYGPAATWFAGLIGGLLGLSLLKFGNPVILDHLVEKPRSIEEFVFSPWPVAWGYVLFVFVAAIGALVARWRTSVPRFLWALPLAWFAWQCLAATSTVDTKLTAATLPHFAVCVACFFLGLLSLGRREIPMVFWIPLLVGFAWVLWMGFDQHFGGLEATRRLFYEQAGGQPLAPEYVKRLQSNRIFSTLFYPNTLAGVILLLLPAALVLAERASRRWPNILRGVVVGLSGYAGVACLFWSGSKSAWLIAVLLGSVWLLHSPLGKQVKWGIVAALVVVALTAFAVRFSAYFQRGAPSAVARLDYWHAAWSTAIRHPWVGTGPGTFSVPYQELKRPEAEMSRLVHNDYLQQASDSGFPAFFIYTALVWGSVLGLCRRCASDALRFSVWLGFLGWACQSMVEFGLYIPALSWLPFTLLGWLWGGGGDQRGVLKSTAAL